MDVKALQTKLAGGGWYKGKIDGLIGRGTYGALFSAMAKKDLGDSGDALGRGAAANFTAAGLTTELRIAHFLAQCATETGAFKRLDENLSYSVTNLLKVFKKYFPDTNSCQGYAMAPEALANKVYCNRLGNGPAESGDGWRFRGRGLLQLTGRSNYAARAAETGLPLVNTPDIAADPETAVKIACLYWTANKINAAADKDDLVAVRKAVNGGTNGIEDAQLYLARAKALLMPADTRQA